jgi:hypothetical protein
MGLWVMRRTPMPARVTPLPRGKGLHRAGLADVTVLQGGATVLPFPKQPTSTIPATLRLVDAILEDRTTPKRTPLKTVSGKRARENRQRAAMADRMWPDRREGTVICEVPWCTLPADDVHEPLTRARGGSITDEKNAKATCRGHNEELTREPQWGYQLGFLKHSWSDEDPDGDSAA